MSEKFRRSNYKSLRKDKEEDKDKKDIESFTSKDGSVTIIKKEKAHKNYRFNKLIKNDEDAKIIQDFCRLKMKPILEKKKEEEQKRIQKEQEEAKAETNSKRGFFSKYRKNLMKQQENESQNKEQETQKNNNNDDEANKYKKIKENSGESKKENKEEQNTEENSNGKKLFRRKFQKNLENSNENTSDKVKNEQEEINISNRYKRKKYNSEEKKEQKEEKKPKFLPTYHEKKKIDKNSSETDKKNDLNDKNYKYQKIEVIPVRLCDDYEEYPRMRFYSPVKPQLVEPYLYPEIIITEIRFEENFIPPSNIGYSRGFNNNINYYKPNLSRNESFYRNQNYYGGQIFKTQTRPFANVNISRNSRNDGYILRRKQNTQFTNHELKTSYVSGYS